MTTASEIIRAGARADCRPWPRFELTPEAWRGMAAALPAEPGLAFIGLWAESGLVHALFHAGAPLIASVPVEAGLYAALSPARPGAALFERAAADLWGHQAANAVDVRPWLDHGAWPLLRPLSDRPAPNAVASDPAEPEAPEMLETQHQPLPLGPLSPGFASPSYWQAAIDGDTVRSLEARLGYAHRGVLGLMRGKSMAGAARIAARIDGAATVAHATAFARAVEAAADTAIPPRAAALRPAMLAIERVAVGLNTLHHVAQALDIGWPGLMLAREALLAACAGAFGHRLMMDAVRPGGVAPDPGPEAVAALDAALAAVPALERRWPGLGKLPIATALRLQTAGIPGRAAGVPPPGAPDAPVRSQGDLAARMRLTAEAIEYDLLLAREALATLPDGMACIIPTHASAEGLGLAEGPHGAVQHWVRLSGGIVAASFAVSPSWLHLPALEHAAAGAALDDLPAIVASFGIGVAGMDL